MSSLRIVRHSLDEHTKRVPTLREPAKLLREALEELEGFPEPPPSPPPFRPRDEFYAALKARAREERWVDLDTLSDLLRDDEEDDRA